MWETGSCHKKAKLVKLSHLGGHHDTQQDVKQQTRECCGEKAEYQVCHTDKRRVELKILGNSGTYAANHFVC